MNKTKILHVFFIFTIFYHTFSIAQDENSQNRHLLKASEDLKTAAAEGDYEEVLAILDSSKKLKATEKSSALYSAAKNGHLLIIQLLYKNGAKLDLFEGNYQPIHIAASKGYADIVRYLLLNGVDVDVKVKKGSSTALLLAASATEVEEGIPETVEVLLIYGADINAKDKDGIKAFDMAVKKNDIELVEVILDYVKDKDVIGAALVAAVESSPIEMMEVLIDAGANINMVSGKNGVTALHKASIISLDKVNLLLKKKASVAVTTKDGETPLIYSSGIYCDKDITSALVKKSNVNKKNKEGQTALEKNSMYPGCKEASKVLVKNGADQNLYTAISMGDLNLVKEELDKGKYTYESLREGSRGLESPLILASYMGEDKIVDYLLSLGANVNVEDSKAVILAIEGKHFDITKTLIDEGVALPSDIITTFLKFKPYCIGAKTIKYIIEEAKYIELDLFDAMILAITENCVEIVEVLLDADINANSVDSKENKIISYATDMVDGEINPRKEVLKTLVKAGAEQDIYIATLLEDTKGVNSFIKNKVDVDKAPISKLSYGQTALWAASHLGYKKLIKPLVKAGADLEVRDKYYNNTPLLGALINENIQVVEELIKYGADINVTLPYSETEIGNNSTLILAILQSEDKLVKTLISEGVDLDAQNTIGETALIIATKTGEASLVCELLQEGADSTIPDNEGNTPTYIAALESQYDIIKIYLSEFSGNKNWESYC